MRATQGTYPSQSEMNLAVSRLIVQFTLDLHQANVSHCVRPERYSDLYTDPTAVGIVSGCPLYKNSFDSTRSLVE